MERRWGGYVREKCTDWGEMETGDRRQEKRRIEIGDRKLKRWKI